MKTAYKKISVELVVFAEDADAVVAELSSAIDRMEEEHTIFGGEIETAAVQHSGERRRSALAHTREAGETAVGAIRNAGGTVASALRKVI
ncbi:MAG TPA: hypothetical protein VGU25_16835 [Acidobacteriaceae bacterium]|nr:hypothetical protein [Acidobacteriaceae bacterium]